MDIFLNFADLSWWLLFVIMGLGLVFLWFGGDKLTDGATGLALHLNISQVIIGLTVVSAATSMPELITSLMGSLRGSPGLAVGNIVGSNIANTGLILGVAALVWPFKVQSRLIRSEGPFLVLATVAFIVFAYSGFLYRWEGLLLLGLLIGYMFWLIRSKSTAAEIAEEMTEEMAHPPASLVVAIVFVIIGGGLLAAGADMLVNSAVQIAERMGVSEAVVGVTIVALGTSLPELAATVAAAVKHQTDIVAGNVVGSNLFNLLLIGGIVTTVTPLPVERQLILFEIPAMGLLTLVLWWFFASGQTVTRVEGFTLLLSYVFVIGVAAVLQLGALV